MPILPRVTDHADGAHDEPEPAFLGGEDMLDARAYPGAGGVAAGDVRRHLLGSGFFALELRLQPTARSSRARLVAER